MTVFLPTESGGFLNAAHVARLIWSQRGNWIAVESGASGGHVKMLGDMQEVVTGFVAAPFGWELLTLQRDDTGIIGMFRDPVIFFAMTLGGDLVPVDPSTLAPIRDGESWGLTRRDDPRVWVPHDAVFETAEKWLESHKGGA